MKAKFYKNIGVFVVILLGIFFAIDWFLAEGQRNHYHSANSKMRWILEDHSIDPEIMIFGSSVAENGLDPEVFEKRTSKKTYNAALAGRRIQDWCPLAFEYLDYTQNGDLIIFTVFPNTFNKSETIYLPHEYYPYLGNKHVAEALSDISPIYEKIAYVPLYRLNHINSSYIKNALQGWQVKMGKHQSLGTAITGFSPSASLEFKTTEDAKVPVDTSKVVTDIYEELMQRAKQKDLKVVIVATPVYYEGMTQFDSVEVVYNQCEAWAKDENVYFFNYAYDDELVKSKDHFANNTHLNRDGARLFSIKLAEQLKALKN